jgi:hypothetical protein
MPFLFDKMRPLSDLQNEVPDEAIEMRLGQVVDHEGERWNVIEYCTEGKLEGSLADNFLDLLYTRIFPCS